ncbi:MAG: hypothetical protein AB8F94_08845 [Saprospiraceae bacterium]
MKNLLNLLAITLLFFATSCQKEETTPTTFPENPYNHVGEEHNQMVSNFTQTHDAQLSNMQEPMEKEIYIFDNILTENGQDFKKYRDGKALLQLQSTQTLAGYDFTNFESIFGTTEMTDSGKTRINNALKKLIEMDGRTPEGLEKVKEEIRKIEITFIEDFEGTTDFEPAMIYLAVLKHSAQHWTDNPNGGGTPTKAKWWQILLADSAGAVIGGVLGGGTAVPLAAGFSLAVSTG